MDFNQDTTRPTLSFVSHPEVSVAPIGIGLIGLGRHGMRYAEHLVEPLPGTRLVAVCRRREREGRAFAAEHACRFYGDYRDLIADRAVQAVVVVTPPSLVLPVALEAIQAGKPLLIEKPLACTGADATAIVRAARSAGVPLMTGHTLRFEPSILAFKERLSSVGLRRYLVLTNRIEPRPGIERHPTDYGGRGALLEIGIHLLDLLRFLTGEEIVEARCEIERPSPQQPEVRAWGSLRTAGDFVCVLDVSRVSAGRMSRAEWIGEDGTLLVDWMQHRISRFASQNSLYHWPITPHPTVPAVLGAFVDAIRRGTPMPISGEDGLKAVEIVDACYQSAETGRPVTLHH